MSIQHKFVSSIALAWLCGLFAGCEIHDYSVDSCVSLNALESKYGDLIEQTFLERYEIEPSEYPEITYYTYERATLTEEDEARARRGDRLPNNALPEHLDYFMAARSHTMMVYEYYTLPRGSDSGFFKGGKPGEHQYGTGIMRGFRKFRTRKYDMLLWKVPRKTAHREYELIEIIFHYPSLLKRLACESM